MLTNCNAKVPIYPMRGLLVAGLVCWTFLAVNTIALAVSFIMRSWDKSPISACYCALEGVFESVPHIIQLLAKTRTYTHLWSW